MTDTMDAPKAKPIQPPTIAKSKLYKLIGIYEYLLAHIKTRQILFGRKYTEGSQRTQNKVAVPLLYPCQLELICWPQSNNSSGPNFPDFQWPWWLPKQLLQFKKY